MYPHRIRLRGPWECTPIQPAGLAPRRVFMPARWLDAGLAGYQGLARFTRKFGYPGNADPASEHIWLTCDGVSGCREVRLNSHVLTDQPCGRFEFDVTQLLSARNQLDVTIHGSETEGLWGEVALEIRMDAYLGNVRIERTDDSLIVHGHAVGSAPAPLELYVLVDGRHADYRTVIPSPEGEAFRVELANVATTAQTIRIDLIHISSIWYAVELPIPHWQHK